MLTNTPAGERGSATSKTSADTDAIILEIQVAGVCGRASAVYNHGRSRAGQHDAAA